MQLVDDAPRARGGQVPEAHRAAARVSSSTGVPEALDRQGYVVLRGALDGRSVSLLRRAFDEIEQSHGTQHVRVAADTPEAETWGRVAGIPCVLAAAGHLFCGPFELRDLHGRSALPGYGQQGLHTDWPPGPRSTPVEVVTAIVMLDDFTKDNGATRVVPGSERASGPIPKTLAQPHARHPAEIIPTGRAGDVLLFSGHLWHSGTRNATSAPRRAIQMIFQRTRR